MYGYIPSFYKYGMEMFTNTRHDHLLPTAVSVISGGYNDTLDYASGMLWSIEDPHKQIEIFSSHDDEGNGLWANAQTNHLITSAFNKVRYGLQMQKPPNMHISPTADEDDGSITTNLLAFTQDSPDRAIDFIAVFVFLWMFFRFTSRIYQREDELLEADHGKLLQQRPNIFNILDMKQMKLKLVSSCGVNSVGIA